MSADTGARLRSDYRLRGEQLDEVTGEIEGLGFTRIPASQSGAGDMLLLDAGPGQIHVAVLTDCGFVHADVRLRRVVERTGAPIWPVLAAYRLHSAPANCGDRSWRH